jgi:hypothetical protein
LGFLPNEGPVLAVGSTGRCNTLVKTLGRRYKSIVLVALNFCSQHLQANNALKQTPLSYNSENGNSYSTEVGQIKADWNTCNHTTPTVAWQLANTNHVICL